MHTCMTEGLLKWMHGTIHFQLVLRILQSLSWIHGSHRSGIVFQQQNTVNMQVKNSSTCLSGHLSVRNEHDPFLVSLVHISSSHTVLQLYAMYSQWKGSVSGFDGLTIQVSTSIQICVCLFVCHECGSSLVGGPISICILDVTVMSHPLECSNEPLLCYFCITMEC